MSKLRPMLTDSKPGTFAPTNGTAYLMILTAVEQRAGLVHGTLKAHGEYCAIGSYFEVNPKTALSSAIIDEVAAVNDSVPHMSEARRRDHVRRWLKWKLQQLNFPFPGRRVSSSKK